MFRYAPDSAKANIAGLPRWAINYQSAARQKIDYAIACR